MKKAVVFCVAVMFLLTACAAGGPTSKTAKGTAYGAAGGAAAGAIIGQVLGKNTQSTLTGAAIGAALGGATGAGVGYTLDQQEQAFKVALADSEAVAIQREQEILDAAGNNQTPGGDGSTQPAQVIALILKGDVFFDKVALILKGDVFFDKGSATVKSAMYPEIERIAKVMNQYPDSTIRVEGYTDTSGSEDLNMRLSQKRAESVKNILVQNGVDAHRMETVGFGENNPRYGNNTEDGRRLNRRVEIKISPRTV